MNLDKKHSTPRTKMETKSYFSQGMFHPIIDNCVSVSGLIPGSIPRAFVLPGPIKAGGTVGEGSAHAGKLIGVVVILASI